MIISCTDTHTESCVAACLRLDDLMVALMLFLLLKALFASPSTKPPLSRIWVSPANRSL